jgi:hypothetical protein
MSLKVFQEHSEALQAWIAHGWADERLLIFDKHFDFKAICSSKIKSLQKVVEQRREVNAFNRRSFFLPVEEPLFGFDDFLFAAWKLRLIKQVHWVTPDFDSPSRCSSALWSCLECVEGIGPDAIMNWHVRAWGVETSTPGLVIRCSGESGLPSSPVDHSRVDFDLDYFDEEVERPREAVSRVVGLLRTLGLSSKVGTATLSISNGFLGVQGAVLPDILGNELGVEVADPGMAAPGGAFLRSLYQCSDQSQTADVDESQLPAALTALQLARAGHVDAALKTLAITPANRDLGWAHYEVRLALAELGRYEEIASMPLLLGAPADTVWVRAGCLHAIALLRLRRSKEALKLLEEMTERWPMLLSLYGLTEVAAMAQSQKSLAQHVAAEASRLKQLRDATDEQQTAAH